MMSRKMPLKTIRLKEFKLIEAAKKLIYIRGYSYTTLALIAEEAKVPLGNVYYYFKTKDEIAKAVLNDYIDLWNENHISWDNLVSSNKDKLSMFIRYMFSSIDMTYKLGCPIGSLCNELSRVGGELSILVRSLIKKIYNWIEAQFRGMGCDGNSVDHSIYLFSQIQGSFILLQTNLNENIVDRQVKILEDYIHKININNASINNHESFLDSSFSNSSINTIDSEINTIDSETFIEEECII